MTYPTDDTIAAIASPPGGSMRGVVRISGPGTVACLRERFVADEGIALGDVRQPTVIAGRLNLDAEETIGPLPCDLYLWPGKRSYTRQPSAELHTIGSPPLLEAALETICNSGARLAGPGEFTLRAFLAGRLDLTQAEAVLGVIDATDRRQLNVSLSQLAGGLSTPLKELRDRLLDLLADLEAGLDFVDEDLEFITADQLDSRLGAAAEQVDRLARQLAERRESAGELRVVLTGLPNVGKSSLLNALAGGQAAIVSSEAGTTRDYVSRRVEIAGRQCLLIDTAGRQQSEHSDVLSTAAQEAASQQQQQADVRVLCVDSTRPLIDWEREELRREHSPGVRYLTVLTKIDAPRGTDFTGEALPTSSTSGKGLDALRAAIAARSDGDSQIETAPGTADRCRESLRRAADSLASARRIVAQQEGEELAAAEIRTALDELGQVVGAVYTDDVLDRIFSRFCVGK